MRNTTIIAEFGSNHQKDWNILKKGVKAATEAGANIFKVQTYSSETLYCKNTPDFASYKNVNKLIKDIELPREWQSDLKKMCDDHGIEFMSTPFDEQAVDELFELGIRRFKIGGFESTDQRFVKYVASTKLPIIFSAGIGHDMYTLQTILQLINDINPNPDVTILHCNNAYPTPINDINLTQIQVLKNTYFSYCSKPKIGLSDHTPGTLVPPVGVALGAETIEKHFTLDRTMKGPDHSFAIEPDEFKQMVNNIRLIEQALGKAKTITQSEKSFIPAMRSVVSKTHLKKGDTLTKENITTKRPMLENSVRAFHFFDVIGKKINTNLEEDTIITMEMLSG
tara:strand:- start:9330 stop:10343 length:1014 start_codon:yes stop_codon:yes gene_type:complete